MNGRLLVTVVVVWQVDASEGLLWLRAFSHDEWLPTMHADDVLKMIGDCFAHNPPHMADECDDENGDGDEEMVAAAGELTLAACGGRDDDLGGKKGSGILIRAERLWGDKVLTLPCLTWFLRFTDKSTHAAGAAAPRKPVASKTAASKPRVSSGGAIGSSMDTDTLRTVLHFLPTACLGALAATCKCHLRSCFDEELWNHLWLIRFSDRVR